MTTDRNGFVETHFQALLGGTLLVGLLIHAVYLLAQPASDPTFARPMLDGAYYVEWARGLVRGDGPPDGAFYLAPLYPYLLAAFFAVVGEAFFGLYLLQHLLLLAASGMLALHARPRLGAAAALAGAALFLLYHPLGFFASRPLGEPLALALLSSAILCNGRSGFRAAAAGGVLAALSALARPNFLLVPLIWSATDLARRRFTRAALLVAGVLLVVLPVGVRNHLASGHFVPISSNGGLTLYHGNGPGARGGFTLPRGMAGGLERQRVEAAAVAVQQSGVVMDFVESDRWWGSQAIRTRLGAPRAGLALFFRKTMLLIDNYEHGLDYDPGLDTNPARMTLRIAGREIQWVPFAFLFGLAAAGVALRGFGSAATWSVWGALLAAALTPVIFYISSRYRLPVAALLTLPAGVGLAGLLGFGRTVTPKRRLAALAAGAACAALSLSVWSDDLRAAEMSSGHANLASAYEAVGDLTAAEREARRAIEIDPRLVKGHFNLAVILEAAGDPQAAEAAYRAALSVEPTHAESATNLGKMLIVRGAPADAVPVLRRAVSAHPRHVFCVTNLIIALTASGEVDAARETARRAIESGLPIEPELVEQVLATTPGAGGASP